MSASPLSCQAGPADEGGLEAAEMLNRCQTGVQLEQQKQDAAARARHQGTEERGRDLSQPLQRALWSAGRGQVN